jgi:NADPH:quinone reductase-like Zn-dependent oxidoreductase
MGLVGGGGYAEYVVVPEREALAVPERLSWEEAGAIPEAFITAHDALFRRLGLRLGERLLIHAVGSGVGTAALQLAKAAGAVVYGTSRTGWKLDRARELGLDLAIETSSSNGAFGDAIMEATGGQGVDAILELVGAPYLEENLECLRTLGRIVVVGLTAGSVAEVDLRSLLRKRATVVGTSLRTRPPEEKIEAARSFEREGVPLIAAGRVQPVVDRIYPLGEAEQAHRYMEENANFGKIVLSVSHGAAAK